MNRLHVDRIFFKDTCFGGHKGYGNYIYAMGEKV